MAGTFPQSKKLLSLLRTAVVAQPGYEPVQRWIGPVAGPARMREAQAYDTPEHNRNLSYPEMWIPLARCLATQYHVYVPDIEDMLRRGPQAWRRSVLVLSVGGAYYIVNGHHRVACHVAEKQRMLRARVIHPLVQQF